MTSTAKENVLAVFNRLGGTHAMAEWAKANQSEFYRLYGKLVPQQVDMDVNVKPCDVTADPLTPEAWDEQFGSRLNS